MNATSPNLQEPVSYAHKTGQTATGWTLTVERTSWHIQTRQHPFRMVTKWLKHELAPYTHIADKVYKIYKVYKIDKVYKKRSQNL